MLLTSEQIACFKRAILSKEIEVLTFDLETSISKFYSFFAGKQYVDAKALVTGSETKIMSAQYMSSLNKHPSYFGWTFNTRTLVGDDTEVVTKLVSLLNKADIIMGQNSDSFDMKVLQQRAKLLRLPPFKHPDIALDTLKLSRKSFRNISHSLDNRSKEYGLGGKHRMNREDWIDIVEGRVSVEEKMIPYGLKDVRDTDRVFWLDLPYYNFTKATVTKILNLIHWEDHAPDRERCLFCEARKEKKYDIQITKKYIYCNNCDQKQERT